MEEKRKKKTQYPTSSFRLNKLTFENIKKSKIKSELTWNLFFLELLKYYGKRKS